MLAPSEMLNKHCSLHEWATWLLAFLQQVKRDQSPGRHHATYGSMLEPCQGFSTPAGMNLRHCCSL